MRRYVYWRHANSRQENAMKIRTALILATPLALALAGCGSSDSASTEAEADTVEIPANEALEGVNEAPVLDPNANATLPAEGETTTEEERIQAAGDSAADTAAAAADAMNETATTAAEEEGQQ
jgi:hypothetical protein